MKTYKFFDFWGNGILLLAIVIYSFIAKNLAYLMYSYLFIGSWQLLSTLIHLVIKRYIYTSPARKKYEIILLVILFHIIVCLGLDMLQLNHPLWYVLALGGIFISPFLAVFYIIISYKETYVYNNRPLSILKN